MAATALGGTRPQGVSPIRMPDLVRWGPVVAGATIGLGLFALLNTLWLAVAAGDGEGGIAGNLAWFLGGTAAFSLLSAGVIAGTLAGARGMLAGLSNGVTAWGLLFVLSLTAIVPGTVNLTSGLGTGLGRSGAVPGGALGGITVESALWTSFWSLLVGLVLAGLGGLLGGRVRRPVQLAEERGPDGHGVDERTVERKADPTADPRPTPAVTAVPEQRAREHQDGTVVNGR